MCAARSPARPVARAAPTPLAGRKPSNTNRSDGKPATLSAAIAAHGPGTGDTRTPAARAARTRRKPGSLTSGVPASDTSASESPASSRVTSCAACASSLCWCSASSGRSRPKCDSSWRVWRVSSAQIAATVFKISSARGDRSPRLPIGVATIWSVPGLCIVLPHEGRVESYPVPPGTPRRGGTHADEPFRRNAPPCTGCWPSPSPPRCWAVAPRSPRAPPRRSRTPRPAATRRSSKRPRSSQAGAVAQRRGTPRPTTRRSTACCRSSTTPRSRAKPRALAAAIRFTPTSAAPCCAAACRCRVRSIAAPGSSTPAIALPPTATATGRR